ncbi:hypothetical protein [Tateyamaria sp. SN6-1]|uniref:hypothetical protein n=1 Tax=Tateyamaria sp. SN6-1 TaxID=3092148 RepID=UPI0039F5A377
MARGAGIWIICGFAMMIAISMAGNILSGLAGSAGVLDGIVQPTAYFGLSTAMLAAAAFWATATWRLRPNAYIGGALTVAIVLAVMALGHFSPGALVTSAYADTFAINTARLIAFGVGLAVLTLWTRMVTHSVQ